MAYEYLTIGTQRVTRQEYIGSTRPDYATKIFHVFAAGSTNNAQVQIVMLTGTGAQLTTATNGTAYLTLPLTTSGTAMTNFWDSHYGTLINGEVMFQTSVGFSYAIVQYVQIPQ